MLTLVKGVKDEPAAAEGWPPPLDRAFHPLFN